jgi:hypothetical protein
VPSTPLPASPITGSGTGSVSTSAGGVTITASTTGATVCGS